MTTIALPDTGALKAQARRLRSTLADQGTPLTHAAALETVARQWGYRDWNTLNAVAQTEPPTPIWQIAQRVSGQYLGHAFTGRIKAVSPRGPNHTRLTITFDTPVDVVSSVHFSSLRKQISATVNAQGRTIEKTSDGNPHLILHAI